MKDRPNSKNRVKFTTMITPEQRDALKLISINKNCTVSDVLNSCIKEFLKNN
jgi:hypothetical protein